MKTLKIVALVLVLSAAIALFAACGSDGGNKDAANTSEAGNGAVSLPDGVRIREISVDMVGSTPNFVLIVANDNDAETELDCSKFVLKKADGTELKTNAGVKTLAASQSYAQFAFPVIDGEAEAGDVISVYYGDELIEEVTVTEF